MDNIKKGIILKIDNRIGFQSSLVILGLDNRIYLLTATPNGRFCITDEGIVGANYDEEGEII